MYKSSTINHLYPRMNQILPNLYLGDIESATDFETLASHNIHNIVSVLAQDEFLVPVRRHIIIPLNDGLPFTPDQLDKGVSFIKEAITRDEGVLVHCMAGISRSSSMLGAYLMKELHYSPQESLNLLQDKREIVDPAYYTFQSAIKWVYPNLKLICTNDGCGKAWDYREKYEFINYALRTDEDDKGFKGLKLIKSLNECTCENPNVEVIQQ